MFVELFLVACVVIMIWAHLVARKILKEEKDLKKKEEDEV